MCIIITTRKQIFIGGAKCPNVSASHETTYEGGLQEVCVLTRSPLKID